MALTCQYRLTLNPATGLSRPVAALVVALLLTAQNSSAADLELRSGVTGSTVLRPFGQVKFKDEWSGHGWISNLSAEARAALARDTLDDASASLDWHSETKLSPALLLELDALYGFDRDRDTDIDQTHDLGADIGFTSTFEHVILKTDVGAFTRYHQDTLRVGLPSLNRKSEDFWEADLAVRLTGRTAASWQPFVETAVVRRAYRVNTGRAFIGPDFVAGVTLDATTLKGDVGVFLAARKAESETLSTVIGPTVDLKWTPIDSVEAALDLSSGLDQETTGDAKPFRFYEANLSLSYAATDQLKISTLVESSWENHSSGAETEITPLVKLEWTGTSGFGVFASAGFTYSKISGLPSDTAPSLEAGIKLDLK